MSDDYITLRVLNDLGRLPYNREEKGELCIVNSDCHPDLNCVSNRCQFWPEAVVEWPNSTSIRDNLTTSSGMGAGNRSVPNGQQCLANSDCNSNYCNGFTCMDRARDISFPATSNILPDTPYMNAPAMMCYTRQDCPQGYQCDSNYTCRQL
jgi:hypothetical protein